MYLVRSYTGVQKAGLNLGSRLTQYSICDFLSECAIQSWIRQIVDWCSSHNTEPRFCVLQKVGLLPNLGLKMTVIRVNFDLVFYCKVLTEKP